MSSLDDHLIGQPAYDAPDSLIFDTDQTHFMENVVDASQTVPILVDFWAPWCGPCRQLAPVLEKVVRAAGGGVRLAKLDIDANQSLAAQLSQMGLPLQSIPLVVAFWKGQVLDLFQGVQPESAIRRFVESLLSETGHAMPITERLSVAQKALNEGLSAEAAGAFSDILQTEPDRPEALGGMIRALLALGDTESAEDINHHIPEHLADHPDITGARAALTLQAEGAKAAARLETLRQHSTENPEDYALLMELAGALNATGQRAEAAETLLTIIRKDRTWKDGAARAELLRFFEAWGHTNPETLAARRKLSTLLFS